MKKEDGKYYVLCPNCKTELGKAQAIKGGEFCCKRCKKKYEVMMSGGSLTVNEIPFTYDAAD